MPDRSRIPPKPSDFALYMQRTDNRQLSIDPATGNPRWKQWLWTSAESAQWTKFRQQCDELYVVFADKKSKNTMVKDSMHLLIKETRKYDSHPRHGHKLLDKIALNGTIDDWMTFRIKQSTSLKKKPVRKKDDSKLGSPAVSLRKIETGIHVLSVRNPETPRSRALPAGVLFTSIYRYIGTKPPAGMRGYEEIGVAKRGIFRSQIPAQQLTTTKKYYAWYIGIYVTRRGKRGTPSLPLMAPVV